MVGQDRQAGIAKTATVPQQNGWGGSVYRPALFSVVGTMNEPQTRGLTPQQTMHTTCVLKKVRVL